MKKTFPVNINGKIFYIDEDAYKLLQDYLSQLRATFPGQEGSEIVSDIECRISELFDERILSGANVIVLEDVNNVIEVMGRPEQLSDEADFAAEESNESAGTPPPHTQRPAGCPPPPPIHKKLYRDIRHKVFGGVLAGLAQYTGWDVTVMRILVTAIAILPTPFFSVSVWTCILIYLIAWMVIPPARTPRQILEMQGQPVTLDNVGQTVINNSVPPVAPVPNNNPGGFSSFLNTLLSVIAKCILAVFGFFAGCTAFCVAIVAIVLIAKLCLFHFNGNVEILEAFDINPDIPVLDGWGTVCVLMAVFIPALALCRAAVSVLFNIKGISTPVIITGLIFEVLFIAAAAVLLNIDSSSCDSFALSAVTTMAPASLLPPMLS